MDAAAAAIASGRPVCRRCIIRSRSGCSSSSSPAMLHHHRSRCPAIVVAPLRVAATSPGARAPRTQGLRLLPSRSQPLAGAARKGRHACSAAARVGGDLTGGGLEKASPRAERSPAGNARHPTALSHGTNNTTGIHSRHATAPAPAPPAPATDAGSSSTNSQSAGSKSTNITWHDCPVGRPERQALLGQKGCVVWITGLSGSGKSTMACALARALHTRGYLTYVLDGDNLRHGLNRDLGFSADDRAENIRRVGEVARLFADSGVICIASLISPYRKDRDACRAMVPEGAFVEVFMDAPLEVCEARDPKGLYKLARAGKIKGFTGIDDPYEPPLTCEITLRQEAAGGAAPCPSPTDMAEQVVAYLQGNGYLRA